MDKPVMNLTETSEYTGLSKSYLYKLTSLKKIPHYKPFGKLCFFNKEELDNWLQQGRVSTLSEIENAATTHILR